MANLRPFFSFYGGKWLKAPLYPVPIFPVIVEPFAGSAGYSVRYPEATVKLFDKDWVICCVWDYLINASEKDILRLPKTVDHVDALPDSVCQEAKYLIGFWLNTGSSVPKKTMSKWKVYEHSNKGQLLWGERVITRIASQLQYIRHWEVTIGEYADSPNIEATWFIDPPYMEKGKHYRCSLAPDEFKPLGMWCRQRKGQVIVCENYGADWLPFKKFIVGRSAKHQFQVEAVWLNG